MTMTRRQSGRHVPAAGTPAAAAAQRPRAAMFNEAKPRGRTRIGADVVCEALLRQGADAPFGYPGGVIPPPYDGFGHHPPPRPPPTTPPPSLFAPAAGLPRVLAQAFYIPRTGRSGPVQVDIKKDALQQET